MNLFGIGRTARFGFYGNREVGGRAALPQPSRRYPRNARRMNGLATKPASTPSAAIPAKAKPIQIPGTSPVKVRPAHTPTAVGAANAHHRPMISPSRKPVPMRTIGQPKALLGSHRSPPLPFRKPIPLRIRPSAVGSSTSSIASRLPAASRSPERTQRAGRARASSQPECRDS